MNNKIFVSKDGTTKLFEAEIKQYIVVTQPITFLHYLEMLDIPYVEEAWSHCVKIIIKRKSPLYKAFNLYYNQMQLKGWKSFTYKDSDFLNQRMKEISTIKGVES